MCLCAVIGFFTGLMIKSLWYIQHHLIIYSFLTPRSASRKSVPNPTPQTPIGYRPAANTPSPNSKISGCLACLTGGGSTPSGHLLFCSPYPGPSSPGIVWFWWGWGCWVSFGCWCLRTGNLFRFWVWFKLFWWGRGFFRWCWQRLKNFSLWRWVQ